MARKSDQRPGFDGIASRICPTPSGIRCANDTLMEKAARLSSVNFNKVSSETWFTRHPSRRDFSPLIGKWRAQDDEDENWAIAVAKAG